MVRSDCAINSMSASKELARLAGCSDRASTSVRPRIAILCLTLDSVHHSALHHAA